MELKQNEWDVRAEVYEATIRAVKRIAAAMVAAENYDGTVTSARALVTETRIAVYQAERAREWAEWLLIVSRDEAEEACGKPVDNPVDNLGKTGESALNVEGLVDN